MLDRLLVDSNTTIHIWPFEQYFPSVDKFNFYFLDHIWIENQKYCPKHILHIAERTSIGQSIIFSCFLYFWKTLIWPSYLVHGFGFTRLSLINLKNFYARPPQAQKEHFNLHCCRQVQSLLIPSTLLAATMMANPSVASSCVAPLFSPCKIGCLTHRTKPQHTIEHLNKLMISILRKPSPWTSMFPHTHDGLPHTLL